MSKYSTVNCPYCKRSDVRAKGPTFEHHSIQRGMPCPLSYQDVPRTGLSEDDWEARAKQIANLSWQLRDCDPQLTWAYLTAIPADELRRLMMVALAAVPIDDLGAADLFGWVEELPAAQEVPA